MALPVMTTPTYETKLISNNEKVVYRPFTVKEEKVLLIAIESGSPREMVRAINGVVGGCIVNDVNIEKLPTYDMERLFMMIRAKSVGEIAHVSVKCESCEVKNEIDVDISTLDVTALEQSNQIKLADNITIAMKHPTLLDVYDVMEGEKPLIERAVEMIAMSIKTIYYGDDTYQAIDSTQAELINFVESLSSEQFHKLQNFIENVPVVRKQVEFNCVSCGHENHKTLEGLQAFFM